MKVVSPLLGSGHAVLVQDDVASRFLHRLPRASEAVVLVRLDSAARKLVVVAILDENDDDLVLVVLHDDSHGESLSIGDVLLGSDGL